MMKKIIFLIFIFQPIFAKEQIKRIFNDEVLRTEGNSPVWGFDFLNDSTMVFTERSGHFNILDLKTKKISRLKADLKVVVDGQGGLLDVRVDPDVKNRIYFTFSHPVDGGATTALGVGDIQGDVVKDIKILFRAVANSSEGVHFGSRIEFKDGYLFFTVGDRGTRSEVQSLKFHTGKVIRLHKNGKVPDDNPFVNIPSAMPEVWALGIRSPQGLTLHPETKDLWEAEMGPRGGDEINIIKKGANYGWPEVTFGKEYYGLKIGSGTQKPGMEQPIVYWVPSISPSAITFYTGNQIPQWKGNLFVATLSGTHLRRLVVKDKIVVAQEELLKEKKQRFRNIRTGPDGALYYSGDSGTIGRLQSSF